MYLYIKSKILLNLVINQLRGYKKENLANCKLKDVCIKGNRQPQVPKILLLDSKCN